MLPLLFVVSILYFSSVYVWGGKYADVTSIGWLYLFIRMSCCLTMMSLGSYLPIQNYIKVVPVLPFSLVERSGVSEDHGELSSFPLD